MKIYNYLFAFFIAVVGIIFIISCEQKSSDIGLGLMPENDRLDLFADTMAVDCFTVTDFIVSTDERTLSPLGSYVDPIFGYTKAAFVCHTRISSSNVDFSSVNKINKIELQLKYSSFYGNKATSQNVYVARLKKEIYYDSIYYSNFNLNSSEFEVLSSTVLDFNSADSIAKISLPIELAQEFTNSANKNHFIDNNSFIKYFNGLYVFTDPVSSGGCIYSLDLVGSSSAMILYYNDTSKYEFLINSKSAIINMFEHDYSNACTEIKEVIADTSLIKDLCYIQGLGGLKAKIKFPQIANFFDTKNIAINKAQLVITVKAESDENVFLPPPKLTLVAITDDGKYDFLTDYKLNNTYFGGALENKYTYKFNIPFHIQELVNGKTDYGIYLFATDNRTIPYRVVLNANGNSSDRMRLIVYYTKF